MKHHKITNEELDDYLKQKNIKRLENCILNKNKIKFKCLTDGYEWYATPYNVMKRHSGCPKCANNLHIYNNNFIDDYIVNRKIKRLTNCDGAFKLVKWECLICNHTWKTSPKEIKSGKGCPKCANNIKYTNEIIDDKLKHRNIKRLGNYINAHTKLELQCTICNNIWYSTGNNFLKGHGCLICKESRGENKIRIYFIKNNIKYICQKTFYSCKHKRLLPFDFYLPDYNILIEYDGIQHFDNVFGMKALEDIRKSDNTKNLWCKRNNIKLIRISYKKYKNIEFILNKLLKFK